MRDLCWILIIPRFMHAPVGETWALAMNFVVHLTLRVKLCGRGLRAEADAARRLPHVSRRAAGGVPPPALVS